MPTEISDLGIAPGAGLRIGFGVCRYKVFKGEGADNWCQSHTWKHPSGPAR